MAKIKRKPKLTLVEGINNAFSALNINKVIKLLKGKPAHIIIDTLNEVEDPKAIIFALVAIEKQKPQKLFMGLNFDKQEDILSTATPAQLKIIFKNLYADDIMSILDEHQSHEKLIFLSIDKGRRIEVNQISKYEEYEIGRIMNPEFLAVQKNWTIKKAINFIKREYKEVETTSSVFVTDAYNKIVGVVKIHDLFFAKQWGDKVRTIMSEDFYKVKPTDELEDVINLFDKYNLKNLPVVNNRGVLIGLINNNDIATAMQDEATEDIYNMYGITEMKTPYLHASVWSIARSRLLWLIILMIAATLTSFVLDQFQHLGEDLTQGLSTIMLVPLLPVLTGTSGNAGSQASASVIRSLSIGEITKKEYWRAIRKEIMVGVTIGLILAIVNFARVLIYYGITLDSQIEKFTKWANNDPSIFNFNDKAYVFSKLSIIAATTSLTLFISIFFSKLLGGSLPIIATKCNIDPTVMSAPILATLLDIVTTTTLFGIGIGIIHVIL